MAGPLARFPASSCPFATPGCARSRFADFDRLAWPHVKCVAVARTLLLAQHPELFQAILRADIARELRCAGRLPLVARLNVVSDVAWERECPGLFTKFPTGCASWTTRKIFPASSTSAAPPTITSPFPAARPMKPIASGRGGRPQRDGPVPQAALPGEFWGYPVIDGDRNDPRFADPAPCIVTPRAKGAGARRDATSFVLQR